MTRKEKIDLLASRGDYWSRDDANMFIYDRLWDEFNQMTDEELEKEFQAYLSDVVPWDDEGEDD